MLLPTKKPDMFTSDQLARHIAVFYDNELRTLTPATKLPSDYWQNLCKSVRRGQKGVHLSITLQDMASGVPPLASAYEVPNIDAEYYTDERLVEIRLEPFGAPCLCGNGRPETFHTNATLVLVLRSPDPSDTSAPYERRLSVVKGVRLTIATGEMHVTI